MDSLAAAPLQFGLSTQIIGSLREVFAQFPAVDRVLVYGSRATGAYGTHSDIDLAVLAPGMTDREFSRLWNALDDLPILFKLDVVQLEQVTNPALRRNITHEGQSIYPVPESLSNTPK